LKTVSGKVLETSPFTLHDHGTTVIPEVRIEGTDGTLYAVRKVGIDARLANALKPGNSGVFHFQKVMFGNNFLVAAEFNNAVEFSSVGATKFMAIGILLILSGIPLLLFLGLGLIPIAIGLSLLFSALQIINAKSNIQTSTVQVLRFKTI
jgi:hypothetical protein